MDLLACLTEAEVEYMLVGGYAVMAHGYIRATEDLDVWLRPSADNALRAMAALEEFGLPPGLSVDDLARIEGPPPTGFRFGRRPLAIDLLTSVKGVGFDEAWAGSVVRDFDTVAVRVIGRGALIKNKRATGRLKDAADVEALEGLVEESGPGAD